MDKGMDNNTFAFILAGFGFGASLSLGDSIGYTKALPQLIAFVLIAVLTFPRRSHGKAR
jgi:hypothetical protein